MTKKQTKELAENILLGLAFSAMWAGFFVYALIH